ncbi:MAG: hypothetical protein MZV70_34765 [Desulfobacterales bacterium]|nr:hypothetical protein [Desulfobacterales bacterium]
MEAIDKAEVKPGQPFVMNQTSAVAVWTEGGAVVGELVHVEGEDPVSRRIISQVRRT